LKESSYPQLSDARQTMPASATLGLTSGRAGAAVAGILRSREALLVLVNAAIFAGLAVARPASFLNWTNLKAVLSLMTYDLLVAVGMTTVLILGGLDLSVGAVMALLSVVMALLMRADVAVPLALFIGLLVAVGCGLFNGLLVTRLRLLPFLVTLGLMSLARGLATVMTTGQYISFPSASEWFIRFGRLEIPLWHGQTMVYGLPVPLLLALMVMALYAALLQRWVPLRQMFFVGQNPQAAALSGLNVARVTLAGYVICTLFVWFASVLLISANRIGYANYGIGAEMRAIAASVVGGASMAGGAGSIFGTFLGVLMLALIGNGFILLNGSPNWQQAAIGVVLVLAVGFDAIRTYRHRRS